MTAYNPLHGPDDAEPFACLLDGELKLAREALDRHATDNIHDHNAMVRAAVELDYRLRALAAAVNAERGETR